MTIEINTDDLTLYLVNLINRTVRKKKTAIQNTISMSNDV